MIFTDNGQGLTEEEIHQFRAIIGESSKRNFDTGRIETDYIGRFGIGLLSCINRKLEYYGEKLIEINTFEAKASQFNHFDGTYTKKALSQRWNDFNGIKIQRDLYSAFLIMNMSEDLKNFDIEKCNKRFENFYRLHNLEVDRLTGKKNLSSIAI